MMDFGTTCCADLEEEFGALFHDLLDLQKASSVHEEELVPHRHTETARVTESQNLLEALRLHSRRELHHGWARLVAASTSTIAAEKVPEVRTACSEHSSMGLKGKEGISSENTQFNFNYCRPLRTECNFFCELIRTKKKKKRF